RFTHEIVFSSTNLLGYLAASPGPQRLNDLLTRKVLRFDDLLKALDSLRQKGKTIVQSHGVFDLIHPGTIAHLDSAKQQGDVLVVTIIRDKHVRRGPGRPVFSEELRVNTVASLEQVDFVSLVDDNIPFECVKYTKPDVFARGQSHGERDDKIHSKIFNEERALYFGETRIHRTTGFSFSGSHFINNFLDIYPAETKAYLKAFSEKYSFSSIHDRLDKLKDSRVLLIGDGIIDEYNYCTAMGKSAKSHLVVSKYITHESFAGGAFAIANHLAGLCDEVSLISLLGNEDSQESFIVKLLKPNVRPTFFVKEHGPTIVKKRYIDQYLNQKTFEVNYIDESFLDGEQEERVLDHLKSVLDSYDLVLVSDFGHGFITPRIKDTIIRYARKYAVNTQTNAANAGYNMITRYSNPSFVCLDEPEVRLAAQDKYGIIEDVAMKIKKSVGADNLIVTLGKNGSLGINKDGEINHTPVFSTKVIDTIGAGDAFFAFTAPCFAREFPLDLTSFIGNAVGALAVQIVGNKKSVEKHELLGFIDTILK
ncbi:MAG TPA: PfkB family carbohydrate kinase, partial [Bacteroidota bacterium]|nr:PfkB family carbohydrate kinase [Bacteroidota bacterium]